MHPLTRLQFVFSFVYLISVAGFSQNVPSSGNNTAEPQHKSSQTEGLRKIETRSWDDELDLDIHIDNEDLDVSIESAVGSAMESLEATFDELEIHIDPIEIDLEHLDFIDHDINIEPVDVDINPMDFDTDWDDEDWDADDDEESFRSEEADDATFDEDSDNNTEKNKVKEKSGKVNKAEGLKKVD